eukprot:9172699-Prorocentrum_lima.AAC.1
MRITAPRGAQKERPGGYAEREERPGREWRAKRCTSNGTAPKRAKTVATKPHLCNVPLVSASLQWASLPL